MPNPSEIEHIAEAAEAAVVAAQSPAAQQELTGFPAIAEAKAGYKTTEFWITMAGVVGTQVGALDLPGEDAKTYATIALAVAYVLSRGVAKVGVPAPAPVTPSA